jgi:hypothetical protein
MRAFWHHIDDICAAILIIGSFLYIYLGGDGNAWGIIGLAAGWAFRKGSEIAQTRVNGLKSKPTP